MAVGSGSQVRLFGDMLPVVIQKIIGVCMVFWAAGAASVAVAARDWPQWRGADRLAIWDETGIVETLPKELKVSWRVPLGSGYAGPAVANGRIFITDWKEDPESRTMDGKERLLVLDEETGHLLWTSEWTTTYRMLMTTYAIGPRATPTVDGDRVYVLGATGQLFCFNVDNGNVVWQKDYAVDYDTTIPTWGTSSPPLVDGDRLLAVVGGKPDAMVVAFDKYTGREVWRSIDTDGELGYSPPIIYEAGGARQLIVWHPSALVSLDPETGAVYWEQPWEAGAGMAIGTPFKSGDYLFVSQLYNGSMMMRLNQDRPAATMLWKGQGRSPDEPMGLHSAIMTPLVIGDYVYGLDVNGELRMLNARTGAQIWEDLQLTADARREWGVPRWATAFLVRHGNRYFANTDDGYLVMSRFAPEGYEELGRTRLIQPTHRAGLGARREWDRLVNWSHAAYANRHVVHRNDMEIIRASLAADDY